MICKYCTRPNIPSRFCGKRCQQRWMQANPQLTIGYRERPVERTPALSTYGDRQETQKRNAVILDLLGAGKSKEEVGNLFGLTSDQVYNRARNTRLRHRQETTQCSTVKP